MHGAMVPLHRQIGTFLCERDIRETGGPGILSEYKLRKIRCVLNKKVLDMLNPSVFPQQIMDKMLAVYAEGAMDKPGMIQELDLEHVFLTRVIPVEQYDADRNVKVRGVVHCTESGGNLAAAFSDRIRIEGLDWLVCMVLRCFRHRHAAMMTKRDVKRAFNICPLCFGHTEWWFSGMTTRCGQHRCVQPRSGPSRAFMHGTD